VSRIPKLLPILAVATFLVLVFASCGDGDEPASTTAPTATTQERGGEETAPAGVNGKENGKQESSQDEGGGGSSDFVPKPHGDSGGGSSQFRVKGGDNSVQEFGEEADDSELEGAATALHSFLDARADEDWEAACSFLAGEVRQSLEKLAVRAKQVEDTSCAGILETLTNPAAMGELRKEAAQADVGSLRIEGERAFVIYRGIADTIIAIPMANEGGSWKVASIAGTPLN
jgi:hypothetical protein